MNYQFFPLIYIHVRNEIYVFVKVSSKIHILSSLISGRFRKEENIECTGIHTNIKYTNLKIYRQDGLLLQYVLKAKFWIGNRILKNLNRLARP